jgi:cadmium resistance protein CadD (predicted permease)
VLIERSLGTFVTAFLAFVATNIDDLFVLLVLYAFGGRPRTVVVGQYVGFAAIVLVSLVISAGALLLRPEWVGFFGLAPIVIGIKALLEVRARDRKSSVPTAMAMGVWPIAAVTFANGGDNIAVYVPLFARRAWIDVTIMLVLFGMMVLVLARPAPCTAARRVSTPWTVGLLDRPLRALGPGGLHIHPRWCSGLRCRRTSAVTASLRLGLAGSKGGADHDPSQESQDGKPTSRRARRWWFRDRLMHHGGR